MSRRRKLTKAESRYVSRKIPKLKREGLTQDQAVGKAVGMAKQRAGKGAGAGKKKR